MIETNRADEVTRRGAALLDERMPGWHDRIDLGLLALSDVNDCVLGQLFDEPQTVPHWRSVGYSSVEEYRDGWAEHPKMLVIAEEETCVANYRLGRIVLELSRRDASEYGFDSSPETGYASLDKAWIRRIRERQT